MQDLTLDPEEDNGYWFNFKCRNGIQKCKEESDGERIECVSPTPRGGFGYCPDLIIEVSGETIEKHIKKESD